jgi:hypothetical protein
MPEDEEEGEKEREVMIYHKYHSLRILFTFISFFYGGF